ncbi:hypothetical protein [Streptomyces sp. LN785]|uniref:hypothetical protein n=1 Tax=Streptomyces sp. LN785 TaxID=3112983 RepID=UPI0037211FE3
MSDPGPSGPPRRQWPQVVLLAALLVAACCAAVVGVLAGAWSRESAGTVRITYEVTGTAKGVTLTFPVWRDGRLSTERVTVRRLPWAGEVETRGFLKGGSFSASLGRSGGEVACAVTVDDGTYRTASAAGAFATAVCGGF